MKEFFFSEHMGVAVEMLGFLVAIITFVITSLNEKKTMTEQNKKENIRATLADFAELRRSHQSLEEELKKGNDHSVLKACLGELERFSVGCNLGAYDIDVVNKMSGGLLIAQYRKHFRDYISFRRLETAGKLTYNANLYSEYLLFMKKLHQIRGEEWMDIVGFSEEEKVLFDFLNLPVDSADSVFSLFQHLDGAIYDHADGKKGYLFVPGSRKDRCVLVAHADTFFDRDYVNRFYESKLSYSFGAFKSVADDCSIGADDRAGCAMLWLLRNSGHSLLILDGEEHGQIGAHYLSETNPQLFDEINGHSFMIQLDRRGKDDFKCYDLPVTDKFVSHIAEETGYIRREGGGRTDICVLCRDICGVNLSVGYYDEHTPRESIVISEWNRTFETVCRLISKEQKQYRLKSE